MLPRRRMAKFCVVAIAAATTAALPAVATAADSGPGSSDNARGAAREVVTATATCPAGEVAIAGGFEAVQGANVTSSYRTSTDTWTVEEAFEAETQAYVVCSRNIEPTVVEVTGESPEDSLEQLALKAQCPTSSRPISGGWDFGPTTSGNPVENSPVYTSRPTPRGWKVRAFFNEPGTLTAFAYCAPRAERLTVVTAAGEPAGEEGPAIAAVKCPDGQRVLGGGFNTSPKSDYSNDNGPDFFYYQSQPTANQRWKVRAANYGQTGNAIAYAVCAG